MYWTKILEDILETPKNNKWWTNIQRNNKTCIGLTVFQEMENNQKQENNNNKLVW